MNSRLSKRAKKTAACVALAGGLVVALTAGTAQADGPDAGFGVDKNTDRVILKSNNVGSAAASATLTLSGSAPRLVNGAAARVTADYSCPKGFEGYLDVELTEVTGSHVSRAFGSNTRALNCNGVKHRMVVTVVVANDYPLKAGKAFGRAVIATFSETDEAIAHTERTITLT